MTKMNSIDEGEKIESYHAILFTICFLATAFAGTVSTLMSVYLPIAVKDLLGNVDDNSLNNISAYINAMFIFGSSFGGFICGIISDNIGRKKGLTIAITLYGLFTILTGFMYSWETVVVCRFLSGFGVGGVLVTTTTLMIEEWPKKSRALYMGFLSISIPIGIFSAGVIDYFIYSWRLGFLIGLLPIILAALSLWMLKESKKWEYNNTGFDQRSKIKVSIFSKQHISNLFLGAAIFGSMLIGLWAIFSWLPTWIQSLVTNGAAQHERGLSMMMLGIGGLIGGVLSGWFINFIGAKKSLILCYSMCAVTSFLLFKTNFAFSPIIYFEIIIISFSFGASQGILSVYIPGLFPVDIRGTAIGFCFNTGRILTAIAVLFVGVLVTELGGYSNSLFIFSLVFFIGLVLTFFAPAFLHEETNRK